MIRYCFEFFYYFVLRHSNNVLNQQLQRNW